MKKSEIKVLEKDIDLKKRDDRTGIYFKDTLKDFVFLELSYDYLKSLNIEAIMKNVMIPFRKKDLEAFKSGKGLSMTVLAENMVRVMGADPHFKYADDYARCLNFLFEDNIVKGILKKATDEALKEEFEEAYIHIRGCLCIDPYYSDAVYSYARVCNDLYEGSEDAEYIGRMKAEALDFYELSVSIDPENEDAYYYLGYAYVNMGLYLKAKLAWNEYLKLSDSNESSMEIKQRIRQIEDPVKIEEGINDILAGRYEMGLETLETFSSGEYGNWWPLHYYLGVAYDNTGMTEDAIASFKRVLRLNGSHLESMEELAYILQREGDMEGSRKYERKIEIIQSQLLEEASEYGENTIITARKS